MTYADGGYYDGEWIKLTPKNHPKYHGKRYPAPNGHRHGKGVRVWSSENDGPVVSCALFAFVCAAC